MSSDEATPAQMIWCDACVGAVSIHNEPAHEALAPAGFYGDRLRCGVCGALLATVFAKEPT